MTASLDSMTRKELESKLKEIRDNNIVNAEYEVIDSTESEHKELKQSTQDN